MPSLIGKRIGGQTYYYLREVARVGGRPKIVSQRYLGKAGDIAAAMDGAAVLPERTRHLAFGDVAAAWSVIERLGVTQIIDEVTGSRRADAAASAGTYLALATLNRMVAPCSKLAFADWWATTAADRWVKVPPAALDHRRFWDAMDRLSVPQLAEIERRIGQAVTGQFGLDLSGLVLDMTNFATFIDSANEKAPIAQRGKAKQKRHDLRLVGLALVVTRDGGIPVVSRAYPGNRPDVTQFTAVIDELVTRYQSLGRGAGELTVTFDAHMGRRHVHPPTRRASETTHRLSATPGFLRGEARASQVPGPSSSCVLWSNTPPDTRPLLAQENLTQGLLLPSMKSSSLGIREA
jgi:hypothetical protein